MAPSKKNTLDVRSPKDHKELMDTIAAHPITIILIHADYCGHCKTYKRDIWEPLGEIAEKKNGMAAIHYDQLNGTPFADAKIKGYPSVILVGKKKVAEFKDKEEGMTNALPNEQARNMELMTELVTSAEPSTLTGKLKSMSSNVDVGGPAEEPSEEPTGEPEEEPVSPILNATARAIRDENSVNKKAAILANGKRAKRPTNSVEVPDPGADRLNSQLPESSDMNFQPPAGAKEPKVGGGGSLYASLVAAARDVGPAVALSAAAVALHKRKRKTRRSKARKGRKTRRSK
jgi:hypothetical protein